MSQIETNKIICGDCLEVMKDWPDNCVDLVLTDPPYGINKAEWDTVFNCSWLGDVARLSNKLAVMPGTWNLLRCPQNAGDLSYKWTLAGHLTNGMTRGALGFGNWIPCVVYSKKIPRPEVVNWCSKFTDWCKQQGISKNDLNNATGTSDMGGWWASKLAHRCQVPTPKQWHKIKTTFYPPADFDKLVEPSDYVPIGDCRDFVIGTERKANHPSPKPLSYMIWLIESLSSPNELVLDPFCGSGTTCVAAKKLGRRYVDIDISPEYCEIARMRLKAVDTGVSVKEQRQGQKGLFE